MRWPCSRRPSASSSSQSRSLGHSRRSASWRPQGALADGHESALGENGHDSRRILVRLELELRKGARRRTASSPSDARQPGGCGGGLLLLGREPVERLLGNPRNGSSDTAALSIRLEPQRPPVAVLPELDERRREQRQTAGLVHDVGDEGVDQRRLDARPALRDGSSIARRKSSAFIGPTSTWFSARSAASVGRAANRP